MQERRLRQELERKEQEIEELKQGKSPDAVDTNITDEELAELEQNFPVQAKLARRQREIERELEQTREQQQQRQQADPDGFEPLVYAPEVQEVIDAVPDLMAWQYDPAAQDKFSRAIEYDKALLADPDWKGKPIVERFAEATRRTKAAMEPASAPAATSSAAPPAAPRTDPAQAVANAPVEGPKSISDFRGGAPANAPAVDFRRMSDEQIMSSLPVTD